MTLVWPPREDPSVTAEDLGPSTLAASTIELVWPRHRRSQRHGQPPARGGGLPRKSLRWNPLASDWHRTWLVNLLPQPTHTTQLMPSILPSGSSTITTFPFHQATSPAIDMSFQLTEQAGRRGQC